MHTGPTVYSLLIKELSNYFAGYLDQDITRAIELTNKAGRDYVRNNILLKIEAFPYYQPQLTIYENQRFAAQLHLEEAKSLLMAQEFIIQQTNRVKHLFFNSRASIYATENNSAKLTEYFNLLKLGYDSGIVQSELLNKVNTLIALSQVCMTDAVTLTHITRLTDEFCLTLQDCLPNQLVRLRVESKNLCVISKELRQFSNLSDFTVFTGKRVTLPREISLCQNLKRISVTFTSMEHLPCTLGRLNNLVTLEVNDNQLLTLTPSLSTCEKLKKINAARNPIESLSSELKHCKRITILLGDVIDEENDDEAEVLTRRFSKCCTIF
jgi:hypothetical protein